MKTSPDHKRHGILRTLLKQLGDIDFADDLRLHSYTQQQMRENMVADSARHS
ncbi:hypothetical protein DPMN_001801 [Dreissena polymorpha]|uniref:Uncharacterized protein n=1 Tax=Dreissena polymorpha TaxID=45954 RepID=A0A9D4RQM9_DREPO|nr:hypothetical protein DPMN_001801 [Dreissena polymorpha]